MKILLLEDDEIINDSMVTYFEMKGHIVDVFLDGRVLLNTICPTAYDIFLLDINTPHIDGFMVLEALRKSTKKTPAMFITAFSDIKHIEKAYQLGCNDYVKKPFDLRELELKVNTLTKSTKKRVNIDAHYAFDKEYMQLFYDNKEVELSKNEKLLLNLLVNNINTIIDNNTIVEYVWDYKNISDNTLRTQMKKLRQKLDSNFIKNLRGRGYRAPLKIPHFHNSYTKV